MAGWISLWLCVGGAHARGQNAATNQQSAPSQAATPIQPPAPGPLPTKPVPVKDPPPTPIAVQKEELGKPSWDPAWDKIVEEALPAEMLSSSRVARAVKPFCPRYAWMNDTDKRAYWAYFFQALAGAEAGLEPTADARHSEPEVAVIDPVSKRRVRSEGLLQLTYVDAKRYGCDFDWEKDKQLKEKDPDKTILQPKNNLQCGIRILRAQLIDRRKPLAWRKSYWSTLQPRNPTFKMFVKQMTNVPDACGATLLKKKETAPVMREAAKLEATGTAAGGATAAAATQAAGTPSGGVPAATTATGAH
ncbi:MAG: hypothetical protein ABSF28_02495 [Terracidiphilus sp.]